MSNEKPAISLCEICRRRRDNGCVLCEPCAKAFERDGGDTHADHLQWCARRVWHFARRQRARFAPLRPGHAAGEDDK